MALEAVPEEGVVALAQEPEAAVSGQALAAVPEQRAAVQPGPGLLVQSAGVFVEA